MRKSKWATPEAPDSVIITESKLTDPVELATTEAPPPEPILTQPDLPETDPNTVVPPEAVHTIPTYDGTMDELDAFAQTRPPDDLFADEFEPITDPAFDEPVIPVLKVPSGPRHKQGPLRNVASKQAFTAPTNGDHIIPAETPRQVSVRGDRSKTGGIKKTKLTEDELSQRMEAVRLKNQSLEAAHARAEADEASFQAREAEDIQKRKLERQNRQQMMGEREKNRQRKINQLGGREWDADKHEDLEPARGSQYRRGAHGGVVPDARTTAHEADDDLSQYIYQDTARGGRGRARGRGPGRGRGRGRGTVPAGEGAGQDVPISTDFPSLPIAKPPAQSDAPQKIDMAIETSAPKPDKATASEVVAKPSWADEMETPIETGAKT